MTNIKRLKLAVKMIVDPDLDEFNIVLLENDLNGEDEYLESYKVAIYKTAIEILEDYKSSYIEKGYKTTDLSTVSPKDYIASIDSTIESYHNKIKRYEEENLNKKRNTFVKFIQ